MTVPTSVARNPDDKPPRRRADRICACGCDRELTHEFDDPFATAECCRRWYGVVLAGGEELKRGRPGRPARRCTWVDDGVQCDGFTHVRGLCGRHYQKLRRGTLVAA